ncbi:hypothetical protein NC652_031060 [Populus alba x Populus x berolinensis]|nr:hypothetical protein NC652_031060 [Populus alba x Populus x berolinensis]
MSKMSPEVLQKMFEMASSSRGNDLVPAVASALNTDGSSSFAGAKPIETRGNLQLIRMVASVELVPHWISLSSSRNIPPSSFPASTSDMQEQIGTK